MSQTTWLVKLYPLERFFFGSNKTFGDQNENYLVTSNHLPQQTTLLGTLRYILLQCNQLMDAEGQITDKSKAEDIIGISGFDHTAKATQQWGKIHRLSPVFVSGPDGNYLVNSREYGLNDSKNDMPGRGRKVLEPLVCKPQPAVLDMAGKTIRCFSGVTSKTAWPDLLIHTQNRRLRHMEYSKQPEPFAEQGIFIPDMRVGIRIPKNNQSKEKGFFVQTGYQMPHDHCFAFYVDMDSKSLPPEGLTIKTKMGAEGSMFRVEIKKVEAHDCEKAFLEMAEGLFNNHNSFRSKIVLLSDTYMPIKIYNDVLYASTNTVNFRYFKTFDAKPEGHSFKTGSIYLKKQDCCFELQSRGSVLFVNPENKEKILKNIAGSANGHNTLANFHSIGYNYAI